MRLVAPGCRALPRHVGIIMDGNGRWAQRRGKPRVVGHRMGARAVRLVTEAAARMGLAQITLFAFSSENWKRPGEEVRFLMRLFQRFLRAERAHLLANDVRLRVIGRLAGLPLPVRKELADTVGATRCCTGLTLCLAVNYGGRPELVDACRALARQATSGAVAPDEIEESDVEAHLYQPDMPRLDLVIRTGGEMRLSNFLLWQAAYAELWVTPVCWPDFGEEELRQAVAAFQQRERRFGGLVPSRAR